MKGGRFHNQKFTFHNMKKILVAALLAIFGMSAFAGNKGYRSLDLLGTWELVSVTGEYGGFTGYMDGSTYEKAPANMKYLYLGYLTGEPQHPAHLYGLSVTETAEVLEYQQGGYGCFYYQNGDPTSNSGHNVISDILVEDGEILHLSLGVYDVNSTIIWIIESLTDDELILRGLNESRVVYKRVGASGVNVVAAEEEMNSDDKVYYDLSGVRVNKPSKGIYVEKKGKNSRKVGW